MEKYTSENGRKRKYRYELSGGEGSGEEIGGEVRGQEIGGEGAMLKQNRECHAVLSLSLPSVKNHCQEI